MMDRRDFLKATTLASAGAIFEPGAFAQIESTQPIAIRLAAPSTAKSILAVRELSRGLRLLNPSWKIEPGSESRSGGVQLTLAIESSSSGNPERYDISCIPRGAVLRAAGEQALLYAVFDFIERQGTVFGIDGATAPLEPLRGLNLPPENSHWLGTPDFSTRGLLPWPDFLNCISVYNEEDYLAYFANMLRMRFNMFGMHVYTQNPPLAESFLSFDFAGTGHRASLETTTMTSWGYTPQRISLFRMGADQFFDRETFGSDAVRLAADNWDRAERTTAMLQKALLFARDLGIRTGIGFEPYHIPSEIVNALPPEALSHPGGLVESRTGRDLLERRLADLLERYPMIDDVWLWQDEDANWKSRSRNIPLSVTPFLQAHAFLRKHAPQKRLVLAGWGGVTRHFEDLHSRLPEDIVFSALNDSLGWDPVSDAFGKLGSRERWPIPWLEDDPSMWLPQFRASHLQSDMQRARTFGCQGMLGIHWRARVVDPTATYLARAAWDKSLTSGANYRFYCGSQAQGQRADELAALMEEADRDHTIASSFRGVYDKNGFAEVVPITPDYEEGFLYDAEVPSSSLLSIQHGTAKRFNQLAANATSALEQETIGYFAGFVSLTASYCDALALAHEAGALLKQAVTLRTAGSKAEARKLVLGQAAPLWQRMAPLVRQTMLTFQSIVATRNDQGQLASMQNKFVRIALERLRLSIKELADELPPEMEEAYGTAISADQANPVRLFIPTRPSLLKAGGAVRIFLVFTGQSALTSIVLRTRRLGEADWADIPATHAGRAVYAVRLGPFSASDAAIEYYAVAQTEHGPITAPLQAPHNAHVLSILSA